MFRQHTPRGMLHLKGEAHMANIRTNEEIGFRLKQLREQAGYSQERLAELMGVSKYQLQKYEKGTNMLNTEKLQRAAESLSVPVQEFFVDGKDVLPISVEEKLLLDSYRSIPNKEIQASILKIATNATRHSD
jgi:transcriptional regulator with XRE-family HTH domain